MRPSLPVGMMILLVLAAAASPTAVAAPASLHFNFDAAPFPGSAVVPVDVMLVVDDFMCPEARTFVVDLFANTTAGVTATFERAQLVFPVDSGAYFINAYQATQTVNLTMSATTQGDVEMTATFWAQEAPCMAPDGFAARTAVLVRVDPAVPPPTPDPAPVEPSPAPTPEPAPASPTPAEPSPSPSPSPAPSPSQSTTPKGPVCGPEGNCGAIGGYTPPEESAKDTPGLGMIGALAAIGIGAFLLNRRKR